MHPLLLRWIESGTVPEWLLRIGIRKLLAQKLREEASPTPEARQQKLMAFIEDLKTYPIAIETHAANTQHYEVPSAFFDWVLGPRKKYSSAYWTPNTRTLAEAEEAMLRLSCERAQIEDGQTILDLGCGWGSMTLWLAEQYPNARITALSNSRTQKADIDAKLAQKGFQNVEVITANIIHHEFPASVAFDRIVSIEMLEHMKHYGLLFEKLNRWLAPQGKLFVHIFSHPTLAYHYEDNPDNNQSDWLTRHFFQGGTMPSNDLFLYFQEHLKIEDHWMLSGTHYEKTANGWLRRYYENRNFIFPLLENTYGKQEAQKWWVYWQLFFLACAELWGYNQGREWGVSHYRFRKSLEQ